MISKILDLTTIQQVNQVVALYLDIIDIQGRVFGEDAPPTIETMNKLASALQSDGQTADAELVEVDVLLRITRDKFGERDHRTARVAINLAKLYFTRGNHRTAIVQFRHAIDIMQDTLGPKNTDTLRAKAEFDAMARELSVSTLKAYEGFFSTRTDRISFPLCLKVDSEQERIRDLTFSDRDLYSVYSHKQPFPVPRSISRSPTKSAVGLEAILSKTKAMGSTNTLLGDLKGKTTNIDSYLRTTRNERQKIVDTNNSDADSICGYFSCCKRHHEAEEIADIEYER